MNTPAISNLINVTSTLTPAAPAAKQPGTSPDTQFNQMLSRGIEQRRNLNEPSKPPAKEGSPAKQASQSTQSAAAKNDTDTGEESTSTSIDEQAAAASAAETPAGPTKAKAEVDAESEDDKAALAASSDELLALVASLTQTSTVAADTSKNAPVDGAAQPAAIEATAAATAIAASAPGAKSADLTSGIDASASASAPTAGRADAAQATLTALPKRAASEATTPEASEAAKKFDASLAQVKDHKDAADANAVPAHAQSNKNDPTAATQSGPELRAAKAAVDTQPAAAPVASINVAPQSPVSMQHVQAAAAAAADKLTPRVGSNNWDQALGQKVVWMVAGEQQSASLTLNPPDLGPLQVVLSVSNSHATVNFTAAQPEVRQALENAVPKLREMLGDAGIQLGQANVSAGTPNNQQGGFGEGQHASRGTGPKIDDDANAPVHTVRSQTIISGGRGLVDTFA